MFEQYQVRFRRRSKQQHVINTVLTLAAGILTLMYPNFLYLIAGGYLIALGIFLYNAKLPTAAVALPVVAGLIIMIFPDFIPFTFAGFLLLFGFFVLIISRIIGIIMLFTAVLILMNPELVAYFVAFFMLMYAVTELIGFYNNWQAQKNGEFDDWEEVE